MYLLYVISDKYEYLVFFSRNDASFEFQDNVVMMSFCLQWEAREREQSPSSAWR